MSAIEVPQVSIQRYLELLKRRRWQVIPVSVIGLLVGGLVAFFIPRYYVAQTTIVHESPAGQPDSATGEDPIRLVVDTAYLTIPQAVTEAMQQLGWEEARATGYQLQENERAVRGRLTIHDLNASQQKRAYAQILVTFKDRDGARSADFLNVLVDVWIEKRLRELKKPAEAERARANDAVKRLRQEVERQTAEKQQLEVFYHIDPSLPDTLRYAKMQTESQQSLELRNKRDEVQRTLVSTRTQQEMELELQANTPLRVKEDPEVLLEEARKTPQGLQITVALLYWREAMANFKPGTARHAEAKRGIAEQQEKLLELVGPGEVDADGLVPNREHARLEQSIRAREASLVVIEAELKQLQAQIAAESERIVRMSEGLAKYARALDRLAESKKDLETELDALRSADAVLAGLGKQQAVRQEVRANAPPRPTEPNILLVALLGCVLGLGLAISLILVLDLVQGTFKTIDDVERGLPVPVLGGMSHLETDEEREQLLRRRRRISYTAAAFLFLCVALVTIFYVDPGRLPPVVRDLLAMLLGT